MSNVPSVELGVLGPLQVRQDGATVAIPGAKPRAILTMLGLHNGSVVSADTLIALLWGDDPPRTAAKALQTHISSLRRALGDGVVVTEGTGWTLRGLQVDATRYKSAAKAGRDAAAAGDTSQAVARFEEALALWRGIPELPEGRRGTSEKTRWIEGYAALVEDRADALLATGRAAELIGELEGAVADAPLRERRWGQLMLALYRAGRQGEALGAYQRARALLAEELGVDPGPDLRRLETAIVAQDSALETPAAQHVPAVIRAVTFLLTDIEGSTATWEADADAMAVALARHDELVEQVVTSRGGRLIKTRGEGDATFSVFERPSAAAAAAIDLQEAIAGEPWALREPMCIRVALHTGEVEFRDGDYFGRAVNRAARLRSLAAGGQILCSGATAELVIDSLPDDVVLADLGTRELRNLARPERVFELRLEAADDHPQPASTDVPLERPVLPAVLAGPGPFVGRGHELAQLFSAWQTALTGATNAMLIAGEPGVGKTRLAGEWSRQAYDQGALVIYGRCDEDLGAPYQPFAEALRSLVPCLGAGKLRGLRGVEAMLTLVPGLTDVLPDLPAPTRADPDTERYALFDAVVAVLGVASASAPVVLILDDLHWAAKPTLLLLRHLLRFGEQARVQILGTYRSTDLDRAHPLAAMLADLHRDGTASRIQLSGLDEDDVTAYVAEAGYHDEELARALASVTGGNPFFLIEALRHVDESGGQWDPSTLPQGVREAVSRRLSRLPAETNKALAAAAVVGSRFALELVEHVAGDDLVDAFDEACKAGIVIEEPGGRYRFNHALVRQSLLAELPSVRRMRLHQRIATTLEEQPGADDELLAELAHHYFECAWAGNAAKAVEYCRRAADQAMARLAYEGAADLYDRALHALEEIDDELPDRDEQIAALLVARCEALLAAGDVASAAGAVSQLQEATRGSDRLAAWAACFDGQLSMLIHPDRLDEAEAAVRAAADKLAELDDTAGEAKAHTVRAGCLARLGRIGDCEIALDDALTAARRAREHRRVNAVLANAPLAALWGPNPVPRAGGRCLDVVRLLRITTDSPAVEATSTRCQAVLEAFRGRAAAARRMIDSARRTVIELGLRHALLEVEQFAGIVELVVGDPVAAEPHLRQAYNGFRRMGLDADTAETAALLGRTCLALDREDEAYELCTESERLAGHALKPSIAWRILRAHLLSRGNAHDEARRVAEAAVGRAERTDALVDHGDACLALATVLGAAGDATAARAAAERAVDLYDRKGAAALAEKARSIVGTASLQPARVEAGPVEPTNSCAQAGSRLVDAVNREAWDEVAQLLAPHVSVESHRKIVGFPRLDVPASQWPEDMRRYLETGMVRYHQTALAVRGDRLALFRLELGTADRSSGAPQDEMLQVVGLDPEGRIALQVKFDVEDIDAALAELDGQYTAAAPTEVPRVELDNACARLIRHMSAAVDRGAWDEVEEFHTPHRVESRRKIVGFDRDDVSAGDLRRVFDNDAMRLRNEIIAVRGERLALTRLELSTNDASVGAPHDEMLHLIGLGEDGRVAVEVFFDIEDIDAATAELDATHARFAEVPPRVPLENGASRADDRFNALFADRRWDDIGALLTDDIRVEDRRRGLHREGNDRATELAELRAIADVGTKNMTSDVLAIRGEYLALVRTLYSGRDKRPEAFHTEVLRIAEIDAEERIVAYVAFDLNDFDAAIAELDARYLAGEAATCACTWSVIADGFAALSRHELPSTAADLVDIDHRRGTSFAPGELKRYLSAGWEVNQEITFYVEVAHQLNDLGAVVTHAAHLTSRAGFEAEWRTIDVVTVEGDLIKRVEVFDETDIDTALAKFEQLSRPAPQRENAASQVAEQFLAHFAVRDWHAMEELLADDIYSDDRRRVGNAGIRRGRDLEMANWRATSEVWMTNVRSTVVATRGERLALCRFTFASQDHLPESFQAGALAVVGINDDNRAAATVVFDLDGFEAAIAELDARYLAGEAADHAHTWSVITRGHAVLNRRELPPLTTDLVSIDHRRGPAFAPGEGIQYLQAGIDLDQDIRTYVEVVHRLSDLGAVCTHVGHGVSREGFDAEWRGVDLLTVDGDSVNRCEVFDEADLDAALAKFDQLSRPAPLLKNTASQVGARYREHFASGDWDAMAAMIADDFFGDDRRRIVGSGVRTGREAQIADMRAIADLFIAEMTWTDIATRGDRLLLFRVGFLDRDQRPDAFRTEVLCVTEIDAEERFCASISFDLDDVDAAFEELDARYLAGEAAAHAQTWSVITKACAALTRRELFATTPDWVNIDHRKGIAFTPGDLTAYVRSAWKLLSDGGVHIETAHRLTNLGAVVTWAGHGTSQEGSDVEFRGINVLTVEGDLISRCEIFDEADLDVALARFEELHPQPRQLANAASKVAERFRAHFATRDWNAIAEMLADNLFTDDRRRVVGAGVRHGRDGHIADLRAITNLWNTDLTTTYLATRGGRLLLARLGVSDRDQMPGAFRTEVLSLSEINADERIVAFVTFDVDDIDAAFEELDKRYLAGEAAAHPHAWSVISSAYAAFNRHEHPRTTPDSVAIDHRRGTPFASTKMTEFSRGFWELTPNFAIHIEAVHRLSDLGVVYTHVGTGTSPDGFDAEWRTIQLMTVEGDLINHCELFDEADLDAAIARFEELHPLTPRLENAASRASEHCLAHLAVHDWAAMADALAADLTVDDRRRVVNGGIHYGRDAAMKDFRVAADLGSTASKSVVVATRGVRVALTRVLYSGHDQPPDAFQTEVLHVVEIDADERIAAVVVFDVDDIDSAFEELDARYLAGEAADHASTWSVIARTSAAFNRHELAAVEDWAIIDHRRLAPVDTSDLPAAISAIWDLTPDLRTRIEAVHRLSSFGAVVTYTAYGTSPEGFAAEWRMVDLLAVEGDRINRFEFFDEADIDAALARLEELQPQAPRLENAASRAWGRFQACLVIEDWSAMTAMTAEDGVTDDRRRVVGAGVQQGRDAIVGNIRATIEIGIENVTSTVIATRGERLVLDRVDFSGHDEAPEPFHSEMLRVLEIDAQDRFTAAVFFDVDDIDAAFEELDARYLAGEAADHARIWSVVADGYATFNRHELRTTATDYVIVDHRLLVTIDASDETANIRATWDLMPDISIRIEAVHRLSGFGAVVTITAHGTSPEGFGAEWRMIQLLTVEGDLNSRCEIFDEADLDVALARLEELHPPTRRLENAATRVSERLQAYLATKDWAGISAIAAEDIVTDDRRPIINAGVQRGRDVNVAILRAISEIAMENVTSKVIATRGERLVLDRVQYSGRDEGLEPFHSEMLRVLEIDVEQRITAGVYFDLTDIDAAFEELDRRYLAGEAAAHSQAWSVIAGVYAAFNRHELSPTTPDWVNTDHRRGIAFAPGEMTAYIRAGGDLTPDTRIYVETVHRLSNLGVVVTQVMKGTSRDGFDAEWREVGILTVKDDLINRCELFDETDVDTAIGKFDELSVESLPN